MADQLFRPVTHADWTSAVKAALKGASLDILHTETAEGICLKPLYTKEDWKASLGLPGEKPFTRGFQTTWSFPKTNMVIGSDPISSGAAAGVFPEAAVLEAASKGEMITINIVPYHLAGANAVQELALALLEAACFLKARREKSRTPLRWLIHFAAGTAFFTEAAKIRAFRMLWAAFMEIYQLEDDEKPLLSVETSEAMLSILDPHVNLLRTSNALFAAVIGNVDYIKASPFNGLTHNPPSELGERMARNIPHILKYEALLDKVADPSGGSYYIESLTEEIGRKAWDLFAEIEEAGGLQKALIDGTIQQQIEAVQLKKAHNIATLRQKMIGVNHYANLNEQIQSQEKPATNRAAAGIPIQPLVSKRTAEPYEVLRLKAANLRQTGQSPRAGLICLGEWKTCKKRVDEAAGILAAGGIDVVRSHACHTEEEAVRFIKDHPAVYYCLCGSDQTYEQFGSSLVSLLKKASGGAVIDSAGSGSMQGVDGRIASGDHVVQKLKGILALFQGGKTL
ncbi:methylmalonyl-CoA mutase family protein [Domibacillus robiginosus]|uniref:methylmalonyl-CoA mutase family protein n=1 Tax=Domibacillus robiginosus TaxID=1071054 RepID=UPI00067BC3B8|nr:methylmalonyl-CoA mutase family protein [Domibacillus robiginosus]